MDQSIEDEFDEYDEDIQNDYATWGKENCQIQSCQQDYETETTEDSLMKQVSLSSYLSNNRSLRGFVFEESSDSSDLSTSSDSISLESYTASEDSSSEIDISSEVVISKLVTLTSI